MIKIKYNNWGGVREESKVIEAIHDQWCTDQGYPIKPKVVKKGPKSSKKVSKRRQLI
tara:strand:+ start:657 stop:827 length:171 start_codon:yes stop_codon:yes gene_type:complete